VRYFSGESLFIQYFKVRTFIFYISTYLEVILFICLFLYFIFPNIFLTFSDYNHCEYCVNMPQINIPLRTTALIGAAVGIALISALAMYFRRRKRRHAKLFHELYIEPASTGKNSVDGDSLGRPVRSRQTTAENIQNCSTRRRLHSKLNSSNGGTNRRQK